MCQNLQKLSPGEGCKKLLCKHNMFYPIMTMKNSNAVITETPTSLRFNNCMCTIHGVGFTLEQIGEMWSLTREAIRLNEEQALKKIRKKNLCNIEDVKKLFTHMEET